MQEAARHLLMTMNLRPAPVDLALRPARAADASEIAGLLGQLGYPSSEEDTRARVAAVASDQRRSLTVAVLGGSVIGLAVGQIHATLTSSEPVARLDLLVVDESARGQGIGQALLRAFEAWARERGARRLSLTSASHREAAHAFYRAAGWDQTGLRFGRILEPPGSAP